MVCPFAGLIGVGALVSGSRNLLVRDLRYRVYAWVALVVLGGGWLAYFLFFRRDGVRIALEVVSVLAVVAAALRLHSLVRSGQVEPLTAGTVGRVLRATASAVASPWVAAAKAWLLAMVAFEWLGRASFHGWEYGAAVTVLLLLIGVRLLRRPRAGRPGAPGHGGAEAAAAAHAGGFDRAAAPDGAKHERDAGGKPWRRGHAGSLATGDDA